MPLPAGESTTTRLLSSPGAGVLAQVRGDAVDLLDGVTLHADSEIGIDPTATDADVALLGTPPRLLVVTRHEGLTRLHAVDPTGPTAVGELTVRAVMRVLASAGNHLWLTGGGGSAVVDVSRKDLSMWPLPLRSPIHCGGAFGADRFVISTAGLLEEWDPVGRAPLRRFRLDKPVPLRFVGGGARQVWMVPANEPPRIEIIPLVNHGQAPRIEVPGPIARVIPDASHERLLIIGTSGAAWTIDLGGRAPAAPVVAPPLVDGCWTPTGLAVVLRTGEVQAVALAAAAESLDTAPPMPRPRAVRLDQPAATDAVPTPIPGAPSDPVTPANVAERLSAWRERMRAASPRAEASGPTWTAPPAPPSWRDHVAAWERAVVSGTGGSPPELDACSLTEVTARFALTPDLAHAVALLYGAHLNGHGGIAIGDLATIAHRRWDEALGRGELASLGLARWRDGRVRLRRVVTDAIDELPARTGEVIASKAAPTGEVLAVVTDDELDHRALAQWLAPQLGPIFAPTERGLARPDRMIVEARARGAVPLVPTPAPKVPLPATAVLLVPDDETALALAAPIIARWPLR